MALISTGANGIVSASPDAQAGEGTALFRFLAAVLTDANDKASLSDGISQLLADLSIEYFIAPQTGETTEQTKARLSAEGQSNFQFLAAVLTDANDKGALSDDIIQLLADLFIEYFIAPQTGETVEQVKVRLSDPRIAISADRAALVALYNADDCPNWPHNENWLTNKPLGEWHGVTTDDEGRVIRLDLRYNHLSGQIPPQLTNLSNLNILWLEDNQLSGPIPSELGNLSNLTELWIYENQLSGSIPYELGNLSNLEYLYLHENQLSGSIPSQLGNLTNLTALFLSGNQLTGCVPDALRDMSVNDFYSLGLPFCAP